jgi:hypothetical protein
VDRFVVWCAPVLLLYLVVVLQLVFRHFQLFFDIRSFFLKKQDNQKYCQRRAVDFISVRIENVFCERTDENILVITVFLYSSFMVYLCLPGKFRSQHKGYVDASMIQVCFIVAAGKYSSVYWHRIYFFLLWLYFLSRREESSGNKPFLLLCT